MTRGGGYSHFHQREMREALSRAKDAGVRTFSASEIYPYYWDVSGWARLSVHSISGLLKAHASSYGIYKVNQNGNGRTTYWTWKR